MAELNVIAPLSHIALQSAGGTSSAGVVLKDRRGLAVVQVFAKKGKTAAVAKTLGIMDRPAIASVTDDYTALPLSPGQWMLFANQGADGSFRQLLEKQVAKIGYVSEQSHARVIIRISGPNTLDVLAKECRLDLHPSVAKPGFCAQTTMDRVGVLLHKVDDSPTFDLILYSGFADSFWHWITQAAAEYGVETFSEEIS